MRTKHSARSKRIDSAPKERRTFTLSQESVALLNDLCQARRGSRRRSVSAVLDELLRALDHQRKRAAVERAITSFYDALSARDQAEDKLWGEFSLSQFLEGSD
jgi:hypothetical protein